MTEEENLIKCDVCVFRWGCSCGKSYANAACLKIQRKDPMIALAEKIIKQEKQFRENPALLEQIINEEITEKLMIGTTNSL